MVPSTMPVGRRMDRGPGRRVPPLPGWSLVRTTSRKMAPRAGVTPAPGPRHAAAPRAGRPAARAARHSLASRAGHSLAPRSRLSRQAGQIDGNQWKTAIVSDLATGHPGRYSSARRETPSQGQSGAVPAFSVRTAWYWGHHAAQGPGRSLIPACTPAPAGRVPPARSRFRAMRARGPNGVLAVLNADLDDGISALETAMGDPAIINTGYVGRRPAGMAVMRVEGL